MTNYQGAGGVILGHAAALCVLAVALAATAVVGHDFRFEIERYSIPSRHGTLDAVVAAPQSGPTHGLVVMVHGDGPVEATHDGLYLPLFEAAADAGYATLSWSKPGVGASSGDWLDQTMEDRAVEVGAAIDWAAQQDDIPTDRIVLWGASQAGWVVPIVAAGREDIDGVVAVSPAINWLRQGRFHLLAGLEHEGATDEERARAVAVSDQTRDLIARGVDYGTYRAVTLDPDPMTSGRWGFAVRNVAADATGALTALAWRRIPVYLMLAEHDRHVDTAETSETYRRILGDDLSTEFFDAHHSLARPVAEDSGAVGVLLATLRPRALFADGVLQGYRDHLRELAG